MAMFNNEFDDWMAGLQADRSVLIGPSGINGCFRQAAYRYHKVEPSDQVSVSAAQLGTLLHKGWSALITERYNREDRRPDVEIWTEGMPRAGQADDVDFTNRIVTDLKSAKDRVWQSWLDRGTPYESYWDQVEVYALGLKQQHGGNWTLRIVAFNREDGRMAEYERLADPERGQALVDKASDRHLSLAASVAAMTASGASGEALVEGFPREGNGPGTGVPCDWCEFRSICWPTVPDGDDGTPQSLTVREDAEALGILATEYLEASAEAGKAESRRKEIKAFLVGNDGDYPTPDGGTVRIQMVGGKPKGHVPDCDAMVEQLQSMNIPVPMKPGGWTAKYPRVNRVGR